MGFNKEDLAYAAGIIDGEGCIYIDRFKDKRRINKAYALRVKVAMTDKTPVFWLNEVFGGSVREYCYKSNKPIFIWTLNSFKAAEFLTSVKSYLKVKRPQAELGIQFNCTRFENRGIQKIKGFLSLPNELLQLKDKLATKMRELNQRV